MSRAVQAGLGHDHCLTTLCLHELLANAGDSVLHSCTTIAACLKVLSAETCFFETAFPPSWEASLLLHILSYGVGAYVSGQFDPTPTDFALSTGVSLFVPKSKNMRGLQAPQQVWPGTDRPWVPTGVHR